MRRLVLGGFRSLDNVIQAPGAPGEDPSGGFRLGGWVAGQRDPDVGAFMGRMLGGDYDLLLGRRTFDIFAAHWPQSTDEPFASRFNAIPKHVVTSHPDVSAWSNSHALDGIDAVAALRAGDGPDLIVLGSSTLHAPLLAAGLMDRLFLLTFPVVLGKGKRLFDGAQASMRFTLAEHQVTDGGVALAIYDAAGDVRTGAFGPDGEVQEQ